MTLAEVTWLQDGEQRRARWRSESALAPKRVELADDRTRAQDAFRKCAEGAALLYAGDYQNARQLLSAMARRLKPQKVTGDLTQDFHLYRQARAQEAQVLGRLLIPLEPDFSIPLRRAPDVREALAEAWPAGDGPQVAPLREVLGAIGAHEWRRSGVEVPALGERVHPHYGVFAPIRSEYVELVAHAPLPRGARVAWDLGTGTGVLAALLAKRGVPRVVATDIDPRAVACARENVHRLGFAERIEVIERDLWPEGRADLVVFNPPWLPGRPTSSIERAIFDPQGALLARFLGELGAHLEPAGEGWLVISDLAELLGLRAPNAIAELAAAGRLDSEVVATTAPAHRKTRDTSDPLHAARATEQTRLIRLRAR